jgi:hypothetical protein
MERSATDPRRIVWFATTVYEELGQRSPGSSPNITIENLAPAQIRKSHVTLLETPASATKLLHMFVGSNPGL